MDSKPGISKNKFISLYWTGKKKQPLKDQINTLDPVSLFGKVRKNPTSFKTLSQIIKFISD